MIKSGLEIIIKKVKFKVYSSFLFKNLKNKKSFKIYMNSY